MAKIVFDKSIRKIKGTMGGMTYSSWKDIATISVKRQHNYGRSDAQLNIRHIHSILDHYWPLMRDDEQDEWRRPKVMMIISQRRNPEAGTNRELISASGNFYTSQTAFLGTNMLAASVGQDVIFRKPQLHRPVPKTPTGLCAEFVPGHHSEQADCTLTIKCDKAKRARGKKDYSKDHYIRFWAKHVSKEFHAQIVAIVPLKDAHKGVTITEVRGYRGMPRKICVGKTKNIYLQADVVDKLSGWASSPCKTIRIYLDMNLKPQKTVSG